MADELLSVLLGGATLALMAALALPAVIGGADKGRNQQVRQTLWLSEGELSRYAVDAVSNRRD